MPNPNDIINQLTALNIKPPTHLIAEVDVLNRAMSYNPAPPPDIALTALTVSGDEVAAAIEAVATYQSLKPEIATQKGDMVKYLGMRVDRALAEVADDIQKSLAPAFTAAAERFTTAYSKLPSGWQDSDRLVSSADHVTALIAAQEHVPTLNLCRDIHRALPDRPNTPVYRGTAYCTVTDNLVAEEVAVISDSGSLGWWGNCLSIPGVIALAWHRTPQEHASYVASLDVFELKQVREQESGFGGYKIQKVRVA